MDGLARLVNWLVGRQQNLCCLFNRDCLVNAVVTDGRLDGDGQRISARMGRGTELDIGNAFVVRRAVKNRLRSESDLHLRLDRSLLLSVQRHDFQGDRRVGKPVGLPEHLRVQWRRQVR